MKIIPVTLPCDPAHGRASMIGYEVRYDDGTLAPIHTRGEMAPLRDAAGNPTCGHSYFGNEAAAAHYALLLGP